MLRKLKFGQTIYELGPKSHRTKQGTPTMGGLMFAAVTCVVTLLIMSFDTWYGGWDFALALVLVSLLSMLIGFVDDFIKVVKKRNLGLIWWQKIIGQVLVSVAFSLYCYFSPHVGSSILIPFFNVEWDLGVFYVPLMALTMIFMINSANLQDGLDGRDRHLQRGLGADGRVCGPGGRRLHEPGAAGQLPPSGGVCAGPVGRVHGFPAL